MVHHTVSKRAFTLTELVTIAAAGCLLLGLLMPALCAVGERNKTDVCLSNLHSLGLAVRMYAEQDGKLPGRLHPAVSHETLEPDYPSPLQYRSLVWLLRNQLGETIDDRLITCPVMAEINPDANFTRFDMGTGRSVYPVHYAVNNWGPNSSDPNYSISGGVRTTNPQYYFGFAAPYPTPGLPFDPVRYGAVPNPDREWMLADAWYRSVNTGYPELQQEGPYQSSWSGEALPNFAPHLRRIASVYSFTDSSGRTAASARIRQRKSDGSTNTAFFDGHAASVPSQSYVMPTGSVLLYGFPGTVNPAKINPPPSNLAWLGVWR